MKSHLPIALAALLLAACGQTGALYLPDEGVTTPVEIRPAPATPPPASSEQPDDEADTDKPDGTAPAGTGS